MRRLVRGVWSLAWLTVLLIGVPTALVAYVGWPLPDHWPSHDEWASWVRQPLTRPAVIGTFAVLAWLLWAALVYAVILEIITRTRRVVGWLRGRQLPPLPTPMQATASGMLGAAVFGMPTGTHPPPAPPVATSPPAGAMLPAPVTSPGPHLPAGHPTGDGPAPAADRHMASGRGFGVELPDGGWVTDQTATAVASVAALVWLQRRRRYLPRPPAGAARHDVELAPLPASVAAIQDGMHANDHDHDDDVHDGAAVVVDPAAVTAAAVGRRADGPLGPADLPAGGVGLTGPGAAAAARGILTAVLLSGGPWYPNDDAQIITTSADLQALLGDSAGSVHATPGLNVAGSLAEAVIRLDRHVRERRAAFAAYQADTLESLVAAIFEQESWDGPFPPVVLLTHPPTDPAAAALLADFLADSARLGVTGVLLGDWPHGASWQVDGDGTTHPAGTPGVVGARLCVLSTATTADLLTLLRQARPYRHHLFPDGPPPVPRQHSGTGIDPAGIGADGGPGRAGRPGRRDVRPAAGAGIGDPQATPALRLRVLGEPVIDRTDGDPTPLRLPRRASMRILVYLAVHPAGANADELIAALWPGPKPRGKGRLHTPVSDLRKTLQEVAGGDVIGGDGETYRLDGRRIEVDLWRLHAAVHAAATALDPAGRRCALRVVVDAYTGDLAAGVPGSWLEAPREATRRHVVDAYAALAADQADPTAALALLQDALRIDPYNEDLHRRAMRAYAARGDAAAVRRLVDDMNERLAEVDLEPGEFTAELGNRLLGRLEERHRYPPGWPQD